MSIAALQNRDGKTDLAEFICNRGGKTVDDCLTIAQELATAEAKFTNMSYHQRMNTQLYAQMILITM